MAEQVVITGGAGGLAQALATAFHPFAQVETPSREDLDVTRREDVGAWFDHRQVDLMVCNAGATRDGPLARMSESDWDQLIAVNLSGAALCAAAVAPGMVERGAGHIVFLSSFSALHPPAGQAAYAAAKAGLIGLMKSLAAELGPHGIRVNAILPGFLETRMTASVSPERKILVREQHVLGRVNTPEAVARFLHCLHFDLPHTSGQVFQLDSRIA